MISKQRKKVSISLIIAGLTLFIIGCQNTNTHADVTGLESWNDTETRNEIIEFVAYAKENIPESDRIAVFDMDGTVVCEKPVWIEMNVALNNMANMYGEHEPLMYEKLYAIAYNYISNPTAENWSAVEENVRPILMKAFLGETQEDYVEYVQEFARTEMNTKFDIPIEKTFYKPMVEVIELLKANGFSVYIVSGSEEGLIWGVASEPLGLTRDHLIGTRIQLSADYENPDVFIRMGGFYDPMNLSDGKPENIYYELGSRPVFACGNTVDDFAMLNYTTTNPDYETIGLIVNHDSDSKEYKYEVNDRHESINWEQVVEENNWHVISIKNDFAEVFLD